MQKDENLVLLYVEDDPEMIDLVSMIISRRGFQIRGASGGRKALELIKSKKPDLILLDLMMPDMDGWEVYQQLKSKEETKNIPVIVITAKAQPVDRVLGLHIAKVDGYITKPFHPQELLECVDRVLHLASEHKEQ